MTDIEMYASLYDIVEQRMQDTGKTLTDTAPKDCCLLLAECPPDRADALPLCSETDRVQFLHKAYYLLLRRPIDAGTLRTLSAQTEMPDDDFRRNVFNSIKGSEEFALSRCILQNDPYADNTPYAGASIHSRAASITLPERLLRLYRKMPAPMKKAAKKLLGAN